jgi:hypothetical protein
MKILISTDDNFVYKKIPNWDKRLVTGATTDVFYGKIYRIGILSSSTCNFVNEMGMFNSYPRRSGSYGHRYYMYLQICLTVFVLNIGNYRFFSTLHYNNAVSLPARKCYSCKHTSNSVVHQRYMRTMVDKAQHKNYNIEKHEPQLKPNCS